MNEVRLGILGLGNMGRFHAQSLLEGKIPRARLSALYDESPAAMKRFPQTSPFSSFEAMIASSEIDAVVIATPHYSHTPLGIAALNAGLHVLVEKPISVHKADCERLIAAHRGGQQVFGAVFNQRTDPAFVKLREMIRNGELGELRRVQWTVTNWFRSQAYYNSSAWRGTWAGEGGGVLLNQCPHNLDLWQWLFGMPSRVQALATRGRYHNIEVEDDVTALLQYDNGMTGVFIASTGEAPGTNRLEIACERGRVILENNQLVFTRTEVPVSEYSRTTQQQGDPPRTEQFDFPFPDRGEQHAGILRNFADAILDDATLIAPAQEGIHSVELANAMLLSSWESEAVSLPLDSGRYERLLRMRIAESKVKPPIEHAPTADAAASLIR